MAINYPDLFQNLSILFSGQRRLFSSSGRSLLSDSISSRKKIFMTKHFNGIQTLGMYVLNTSNSCHFICIDIDIPKDKLSEIDFKNPASKFEYLKEEVFRIKKMLTGNLELNEENILCEDSGGRGYHIWIFFESPYEGYKALSFCNCLREYNLTNEIFPKQS